MYPKPAFFLLLCLGTFLSCEDQEKNSSPSWKANLYVRYLSYDGSLRAEAIFRENDSLARAVELDQVLRFNDLPMELDRLPPDLVRYELETRGDYPGTFSFAPLSDRKKSEPITLEMEPLDTFFLEGKASRSGGLTLIAPGAQLGPEESLILLFSDTLSKVNTITLLGPTTDARHTLRPEQLSPLRTGPQVLFLVKKQGRAFQAGDFEVSSLIEFFTPPQSISLAE